jgi:hypothetical protein
MSIRRLLLPPTTSAALCLLLAGALVACALSPVRAAEKLETSLREAVHSVTVAEAGANIVVTSFRPRGEGPFPWIVLSHGTAPTAEANRALGRYRPLNPVREWGAPRLHGARAGTARLWRERRGKAGRRVR